MPLSTLTPMTTKVKSMLAKLAGRLRSATTGRLAHPPGIRPILPAQPCHLLAAAIAAKAPSRKARHGAHQNLNRPVPPPASTASKPANSSWWISAPPGSTSPMPCAAQRADPDWENWFDDDRNIPPQILWTDRRLVDELIQRIHQRIRQVQPAPTGYPNHDRP